MTVLRAECKEYKFCSISRLNESAGNLLRAGRTGAQIYIYIVGKLKHGLSRAAERTGNGPRVTAIRIRNVYGDKSLSAPTRQKRLEEDCKKLGRYIESNVPSIREQALDHVIDLSIHDDHIREILKSSVVEQTISSMRADQPSQSDTMGTIVQTGKLGIAHAALHDEKIGPLVANFFKKPQPRKQNQPVMLDLMSYSQRREYDALILRHIHRRIVAGEDVYHFALLEKILGLVKPDSQNENIEWLVLDPIIQYLMQRTLSLQQRPLSPFLKIVLCHQDKLPNALDIAMDWVSDMDSKNPDRYIYAYKSLYDYRKKYHHILSSSSFSTTMEERLGSPSYMAVAKTIEQLSWARNPGSTLNSTGEVLGSENLSVLGICIDSGNERIKRILMNAIELALSTSRYSRRDILKGLAITQFSKTAAFYALLEETAQVRMPEVIPKEAYGLGKGRGVGPYLRHCGKNGETIHLASSECNGECGAVEEHRLLDDPQHIFYLKVKHGEAFCTAGHFPLNAGYTPGGNPLYMARITVKVSRGCFCTVWIKVEDGNRLEDIRIRAFLGDGTNVLLDAEGCLLIPVLRYDPSAYAIQQEKGGMDPTGPFSWNFRRKLPCILGLPQRIPSETHAVQENSIPAGKHRIKIRWVESWVSPDEINV